MKTSIAILSLVILAVTPGCASYKLETGTKIVFKTDAEGTAFREKFLVDCYSIGRWVTLDKPVKVSVP